MVQLEFAALFIAAAAVLLVVLAAIFIRLGDGRYAERFLAKTSRIRPWRRRMIRAYIRDLEKTNPLAARAFSKVERVSGDASVRHTEAALSVLSTEERRAYLDLFDEQQQKPLNRAQRRRIAKSAPRRPRGRNH